MTDIEIAGLPEIFGSNSFFNLGKILELSHVYAKEDLDLICLHLGVIFGHHQNPIL